MSVIRVEQRMSGTRRWTIALLAVGVLVFAQSGEAADGIRFFKNYFVTGDYVVGSVDLQPQQAVAGRVMGTIPMTGVPANADILAAFLYWETITIGEPTSISAKFRDDEIGSFAVKVGQSPVNPSTAPCWAKSGTTNATVTTWRVDVLRSLPIGHIATAANFRKRLVNDADLTAQGEDPHRVFLPDSGTGNQFPESSGASLVVIYRHSDSPLTGIVLYEGFNFTPSNATMSQTLRGFFQHLPGASGRFTEQVSNGQPNPTEQVSFNGALQTSLVDPFNSSPSSQRGWRSLTLTGLNIDGTGQTTTYGEEVTTAITHTSATEECLSVSGFQFSVPVLDTDRDGLLNMWESTAVANLRDPDDTPLPNLYAMRARPDVQDVFVEVGFMTAGNNTRYGPLNGSGGCVAPVCEIDLDGHSHLPLRESLEMVATAFRNAYSPRAGGISGPINFHFDVGSNYQSGVPSNTDPRCLTVVTGPTSTWVPSCAIVPSSLARGGDVVPETACSGTGCSFPDFPGTVAWKIDYRLIREKPINYSDEVECAQHTDCERRFDHNRRYTHRYALFAHALGLPAATTNLDETPYDDRVTPTRASGIADFPGGDLMVTLGRWDDFTGSMFMQASTLMHEFGHTAMLRHGGLAGQANCRPNFQTVMNYLFQVRGLYTISGNTVSDPIVDYSRQPLGVLNENSLSEPAGLGSMTYATRWFAPWGSSLIDTSLHTSPAKRHCDGSPLSAAELADALEDADGPGPLAMARVDGQTMSGPIDWSANGAIDGSIDPQDISFSGTKTDLGAGLNDWALLDLRQVGSRRNIASLNATASGFGGALSLGLDTRDFMGGFDADFLGGFDADFLGGFDADFLGGFDADFLGGYDADFLGGFDADFLGDSGSGPQGLGDVIPDSANAPHGDLNLETAVGFGNAPHIQQARFFRQPNRVTLTVRRPHAGKTLAFEVYRVEGGLPVTPAVFAQRVFVGTFQAATTPTPPSNDPTITTIDDTTITPNKIYTYFALAIVENPNTNPATSSRTGISPYKVVTTK